MIQTMQYPYDLSQDVCDAKLKDRRSFTEQIIDSQAPDNKNYTRIQKYLYPGINVNLRGPNSNHLLDDLQKFNKLSRIL
jgi:hypothetical protein